MRGIRWSRLIIGCVIAVFLGCLGGVLYWSLSDLPEIRSLESYSPLESTRVYSSDGKLLAEFYVERRNFVPHYSIPDRVKKAFIAIEDQRFYSHPGVDLLSIVRALYRDIMAKTIVEGGSTITQQLTKMLFLKPERSLSRKVKEAIISVQIEKRYTKDEILGMYLNQAYFGTRAYGIEAAAQTYFGKPISQLSVGELALLAALPKAPNLYSPFKRPEKAKARRDIVLRKMLENGYISKAEFDQGRAEPLPAKPHHRRYEAPYFVEFLRQQLEGRYGEDFYASGLRIHSTIDSRMQRIAEESVQHGIAAVEKRVRPGVQAALIAMDLKTGSIRALVGGTDFWESQFNRATMAIRQAGSAFKPFVFAAAVEQGIDSDDKILDSPISFAGAGPRTVWSPRNYDNKYRGYVSLKTALALSLNSATVRLAHGVGLDNVIMTARKCGIRSRLDPYLSTALGASDVVPLELTAAYAALATGKRIEPVTYERIDSRDGVPLEETRSTVEEALDPDSVRKMRELLRAVVEMGTATRAREITRPVYGKTGTTNEFSDAWFVGFDERLAVGVWVGRDNHKPIGHKEAGARAALPIWIEFMTRIAEEAP
ncbi:MAG: penicillin-binding protein 1A [Chloroflexota bacterium]